MSNIITLLNQGVELFKELVGISKNEVDEITGDYDDIQVINRINEALILDSTGITAVLLLRYYTESKLADRTFNWLELLRHPELASQLNLPRKIISLIESPLITEISNQFQKQLSKALSNYGAMERTDIQKLVNDHNKIALLRHDALKSIKNLRIDQFLDGENDPVDTIPIYAKTVHKWWNINTMIEHLVRMPSGVSLNLIREADGYSSYFAFAIRNGSRLFVLSDLKPVASPLLRQLSSQHSLNERMSSNWFPYDLLDFKTTEDGHIYFDSLSQSTTLVARQSAPFPLKKIIELEPQELVWICMMLDLILEKFWRNDYQAEELSYTGEMIQLETILLNTAQAAGLPVPRYKTISLSPITLYKIKSDDQNIKNALGYCQNNQFQWMVDRYSNQCNEESLNLISNTDDVFLIGDNLDLQKLNAAEVKKIGLENLTKSRNRIHQLKATTFGTKEKLDKDRIWLARYNVAQQIQDAAIQEFNKTKIEVFQWFRNRILKNLPTLLTYIGHDNLYRPKKIKHFETVEAPCCDGWIERNSIIYTSFMKTTSRDESKKNRGRGWYGAINVKDKINGEQRCVFTGAKISFMKTFWPVTAQDIALLAGCEISELPDVLQNFYGYKNHSIHNYQRVDPFLNLSDPWNKLNLSIEIGLSKKGLKMASAIKSTEIIQQYLLEADEK